MDDDPRRSGAIQPILSVVVLTVYSEIHLLRCLAALEAQAKAPLIEIIAVCDSIVENISEIQERFPSVIFYHLPGRRTEAQLLGLGIRNARGQIVALTADHCTPESLWCSRIIEAHKAPHAAIGGAIEKGIQADSSLNWAVHFYDDSGYGYFMNPATGPAKNLSVCNVSYKRAVLAELHLGNDFDVPSVNRHLLRNGKTLWLSSDLVVYQNRTLTFKSAIREPYARGRTYSGRRRAEMPPLKNALFAVCSPFLPFLLVKRLLDNARLNRIHMRYVIKALPIVFILVVLWSWGELVGYIRGADQH
jgi:glycosyltransferase involved in cell wall biosynthesis